MANLLIIAVVFVVAHFVFGVISKRIEGLISSIGRLLGLEARVSSATTRAVTSGSPGQRERENLGELKAEHDRSLRDFLSKISSSSQAYYVENKTMEFLREALKGRNGAPGHEYYNRWSINPDVPAPIKEYGKYVHDLVRAKHHEDESLKKKEEKERHTQSALDIFKRHEDKVEKFLEIAFRKVSTVDDYGDENPTALKEEILRFLRKVAAGEQDLKKEMSWLDRKKGDFYFSDILCPISAHIASELNRKFQIYYRDQKGRSSAADKSAISRMTGVEFEQYLIQLLKECGVGDPRGTSVTGDQGADILFSFDNLKVVVQAKRYEGTVGNKAVQEVHAAKGFYKCDRAWVITNSTLRSLSESFLNVRILPPCLP